MNEPPSLVCGLTMNHEANQTSFFQFVPTPNTIPSAKLLCKTKTTNPLLPNLNPPIILPPQSGLLFSSPLYAGNESLLEMLPQVRGLVALQIGKTGLGKVLLCARQGLRGRAWASGLITGLLEAKLPKAWADSQIPLQMERGRPRWWWGK